MSTEDKAEAGGLGKPCRKFLLGWVDEVAHLDRQLDMISSLCDASDGADVDPDAIGATAHSCAITANAE